MYLFSIFIKISNHIILYSIIYILCLLLYYFDYYYYKNMLVRVIYHSYVMLCYVMLHCINVDKHFKRLHLHVD